MLQLQAGQLQAGQASPLCRGEYRPSIRPSMLATTSAVMEIVLSEKTLWSMVCSLRRDESSHVGSDRDLRSVLATGGLESDASLTN